MESCSISVNTLWPINCKPKQHYDGSIIQTAVILSVIYIKLAAVLINLLCRVDTGGECRSDWYAGVFKIVFISL